MYGTFFMVIWCSYIQTGLMQTTSWDLVASFPVQIHKNQRVELRCTISNGLAPCCTSLTRTWNKGSSPIMSNGVTSSPSKYSETLNAANNQFSLIINNVDIDDLDVIYTCEYGSTAVPNTLAQNGSFVYLSSESYSVKIDKGELVGTLSVAMSSPAPSVSAQYGGANFTSYLKTTIAPVTGSPKFYSIYSYIKAKATCGHDEKFTLSVLTGVTTTNIYDNVDFCKCGDCGGICYGWAALGTLIAAIVFWILLCKWKYLAFLKLDQKLVVAAVTFVTSLIVNAVIAFPIGVKCCFCVVTGGFGAECIPIGFVTYAVTFIVMIALYKNCDCHGPPNDPDKAGSKLDHGKVYEPVP